MKDLVSGAAIQALATATVSADLAPTHIALFERAAMGDQWIAYQDTGGSGPVVLCMPGIGDVRQEYRFLLPRLRDAGYRVLLMDLRGHGDSSVGFADYSPKAFAEDALTVLDQAKVVSAILIGCSMSGGAIAWAAAKAPERVQALVMLSPFARDQGQNGFRTSLNHLLYRILFSRPWGATAWGQFYASLYRKTKPHDFSAYQAALVASLKEPGRLEALQVLMTVSHQATGALLGQVKAPTLILMGAADPDFSSPRQEGETLRQMLSGTSQVDVLEGLGHYPHVEDSQGVMERIQRFLAEVDHGT